MPVAGWAGSEAGIRYRPIPAAVETMGSSSVLGNDDFGPARTLSVLAGHEHDDDADRLATACRLRRLGQGPAILLGYLLADRVAIRRSQYDRISRLRHVGRECRRPRRKQPGRTERQYRGSEVGARRFHGRRCNASVLNVK